MEKWRLLEGRRLDWSTRVDGVVHRVQLDKYASHATCSVSELGYADDLGLLKGLLRHAEAPYTGVSVLCCWVRLNAIRGKD